MLRNKYELQMSLPDCNHFATVASAKAELADDITEVLPYLNAVLSDARYFPNVPALAFEHEGRRIVLRSRQAAVAGLENEREARRVTDWLVAKINETWARRAEIEPSYRVPKELKLLDLYRLLPGDNCRTCGEPTCLAFAAKLVKGTAAVESCTPLCSMEHQSRRQELLNMVGEDFRA